MIIYNSSKKAKVPFKPIEKGKATIYVCGPTVYDDAHLGHARSALSFDLLVRTLKANGYIVTLAKNFTDIDDKIIKKISSTGKTLENITTHYIKVYLDEMEALGVQRADIEPKATENIQFMIDMIQKLIDKDYAYQTSSGDVYFDTSKDELYGSISHKVINEEENRSRVSHNDQKRNLKDFAIWKACKENESICFDSPFSKGRPGWHIECSVMIDRYFKGNEKYQIDIHGGGADLLFPHHENEAAQSRCATGKELAKYWMHNGFVQINGEKMSKSLGNSFFIKDALSVYGGELLRYYLISVHYRSDFNFNEEDLLSAKKRLDKLYRLKKRVIHAKASAPDKEFKQALVDAMSDDMNISKALSIIDEMVASTNDELDKDTNNKQLARDALGNIELIDKLLGFGSQDPSVYLKHGIDQDLIEKIDKLITQRIEAKKQKDFKRADQIRDELNSMGISIMDTTNGTTWEKA